MDFARYSINNATNIWLVILVFLIGGILALNNIGRLEDPAFTIKQVQVITMYPGASADKVEHEITDLLEIAIQQMPQLHRLDSISMPGVSQITVEVKSTIDSSSLPQVWDELRKRVRDASIQLPLGSQTPSVYDDFGDVYGMYFALTAPDFSAQELRELSRVIRRELLTTEGVAKVQVSGVEQEELVAYIHPYQISGLGISFPDIVALLAENLKPFSGGRVLLDGQKIRIVIESDADRIEELYNLTMVVPGTTRSIKVRDIAELKLEPVDVQPIIVRYNGQDAVTLAVSALQDVNIVDVGNNIAINMLEILNDLPAGITLSPIYDQGSLVQQSVEGFISNLVLSVSVVTITLCLFMGWRSGVVVGSVLLITVMGTVLIIWLMGLQLQRISLGAMVIAMGMLVDNAIVVAEGMMLRMNKGKSSIEAASFIVKRTKWPLLGATIIGAAAFSGIGLSNDATGEFLYSLFVVVLVSLMLSWVLAITVVPLFGSYFYRVGTETSDSEQSSRLGQIYVLLLQTALKFRWLAIALLVFITVIAYASFGMVKQGFFPSSNAPLFFVHYWGPQSQDISKTSAKIIEVEKAILEYEEVESLSTFVGRGADRFTLTYSPQQSNESYGFLLIRTENRDQIPKLIEKLNSRLKSIDLSADFFFERMQFGPGGGAKIAARVSGPDSDVLREVASQVENIMINDGQIRDIRHNWRDLGLALNTHFDAFSAGIAGVSRNDFSQAVQYASSGLELGTFVDGDYQYSIKAKMAHSHESEIEAIENNLVWSSSERQYIPFHQVSGGIELHNEETLIHRRNRLRTITISAEPAFNETAGAALSRIRPAVQSLVLPEGYALEWGGELESAADAQKALGAGLPAGFLVMFLVSVLLFGRVRQPLIIWLTVPMAVVGVVAGLLASNMPFGFMSLLGFLSLFGMLIKNSIVLIEEIDIQIEEGKPQRKAILEASVSRLRPVTLAAVTTILGMAPLLFDPFFADMAVTIMGGLAFATVLTLIAVPVLYAILFKVSYRKQ